MTPREVRTTVWTLPHQGIDCTPVVGIATLSELDSILLITLLPGSHVPMNKITCPECGAGLKSQSGFEVGQAVRCPKCKNQFDVEEPDDDADEVEARKPSRKPVRAAVEDDDEVDEEDERPRKKKKKKKRRDDDEDDGKSNIAFYIRLGILLAILIGLAIAFAILGPGGFNKQN